MNELTRRTFRQEQRRAVAMGVIETAGQTFLVLIAVAVFHAGATSKALLVLSTSLGLLASPVVLGMVRRGGWRVSAAAGSLFLVSGAAMAIAALLPDHRIFVPCAILAFMMVGASVPLGTKMYQDNYPDANRGTLFSKSVVVRIVAAAVFAWMGGHLLESDLGQYRLLIAAFSVAFFFSALCLFRCPSKAMDRDVDGHPLHSLHLVREDRVFRWTLWSWMFLGFGNLVMLPLRVEYLANPDHGIALSPGMVALFTGVLPNVSRLLMSRVWGFLFDRMNFFLLRLVLNVGFMAGTLAFFLGTTMAGFMVGSLLFGVALAGGDIAWSLWVTKIAPPGKVAEYMSVHTFFTGLRGIFAPFAAFYLIKIVSIGPLAWGCVGLMVFGSLFLLPEVKSITSRRPGQPLTPDGDAG